MVHIVTTALQELIHNYVTSSVLLTVA